MPGGLAVLERLGLADAVGGVPFYGVRYYAGSLVAEGRFPTVAGIPASGRGPAQARTPGRRRRRRAITPALPA
jgi:hypothetical protein